MGMFENFGFVSKKKISKEIADIYNCLDDEIKQTQDKDIYYMETGGQSALNWLCSRLKVKKIHLKNEHLKG